MAITRPSLLTDSRDQGKLIQWEAEKVKNKNIYQTTVSCLCVFVPPFTLNTFNCVLFYFICIVSSAEHQGPAGIISRAVERIFARIDKETSKDKAISNTFAVRCS